MRWIDSVIGTHYDGKYYYPKEAVIVNGVLNREILQSLNKDAAQSSIGASLLSITSIEEDVK